MPSATEAGTLAFYGPDDKVATKVVASMVETPGANSGFISKWFSEDDVRRDVAIMDQVMAFFEKHHVLTVVMPDRIIGCPHEEGIDYPGPVCPQCPFWAERDRWTGDRLD